VVIFELNFQLKTVRYDFETSIPYKMNHN